MALDVIVAYTLYYLGAPRSPSNAEAMMLWSASENTPDGWHNPLATTLPMPGSVAVNAAGVQAYPDDATGVEALVSTLLEPQYAGVVDAFRTDAGRQLIWERVNASPWCSGCEGGRYPQYVALSVPVNPPAPLPPPTPGPNDLAGPEVIGSWERFRGWAGVGASWVHAAATLARTGIEQH